MILQVHELRKCYLQAVSCTDFNIVPQTTSRTKMGAAATSSSVLTYFFFFFFQIGANSGWVISHHGEKVQLREVKAVVQTVTNGNNDEQIKTVSMNVCNWSEWKRKLLIVPLNTIQDTSDRVFIRQMTQSTVSKHWRKPVSRWDQISISPELCHHVTI